MSDVILISSEDDDEISVILPHSKLKPSTKYVPAHSLSSNSSSDTDNSSVNYRTSKLRTSKERSKSSANRICSKLAKTNNFSEFSKNHRISSDSDAEVNKQDHSTTYSNSKSTKSSKHSKPGTVDLINFDQFSSPIKIDAFKQNNSNNHKDTKGKKAHCYSSSESDSNYLIKRNKEHCLKNNLTNFSSSENEHEEADVCLENIQSQQIDLNNSFLSIKSHHSISDSDSSISLTPPVSKRKKIKSKQKTLTDTEKQKEKQRKAEEKLKKKKAEVEQKERKKKIAESLRKFRPGECLKHLTTKLDISITQEPYGKDVLSSLESLDTKYEIIHQPLPSTITWLRDGSDDCEEDLVLVIWSGEKFVNLVAEMKAIDEINKFKRSFRNKRLILVVFGYEFYMKKLKKDQSKKTSNISSELRSLNRTNVDVAMIQLQLVFKCNSKILDTRADIALHISQVTKSIAEMPFRLEKQKLEEKSDWHANSDSKDCVKVDRMGNGLARLWRQQLCQFNNVTLDMSNAIAQVYKTPNSLLKAYQVCNTRREGEKLLADIVVRRGRGPSSTTRPIGIELSKKIYTLFNSTDPEKFLSQNQAF